VTHNRAGLLVVRVWVEGDSAEGRLRARITQTVDLFEPEVITTAATTDDVYAAVRGLLEAYLAP